MLTSRRRRGLSLAELLVVVGLTAVLLALVLPAVRSARASYQRTRCQWNLRQIGAALLQYESACQVLPFGVGADYDLHFARMSSPLARRFSVHSQLLPYLDQSAVYDLINFSVTPFFPNGPEYSWGVTGRGENETVAQVRIATFLCPADRDRLPEVPWGKNNYRSCTGNTIDGRQGNGLFSQARSVRLASIVDGLSHTAAFSERLRGDGARKRIDRNADLFRLPDTLNTKEFVERCASLDVSLARTLYHDVRGGQTWLEGNMNWTRYNHVLPPYSWSCKRRLTWEGTAMSATSAHGTMVNLLMADGSVRAVDDAIEAKVWRDWGGRADSAGL